MNYINKKKYFFAFLFFVFTTFSIFAIQIPKLTGPVIDQAKLLSNEQFNSLEKKLYQISEQTKSQIVVVTIPSLEGLDIESYTMSLAEKWKIGSKEKDDGVILCVAYKEKKIRIEVGYGLEGVLTDAKAGLIIRKVMAPKFQQGEYGQGIIDAVNAISSIIGVDGIDFDNSILTFSEDAGEADFPVLFFFLLFHIIVISGALATKFPWLRWLPWYFLFKENHNSKKRKYNDKFWGSGFSSGSSSGFGGFSGRGGGFGGGGASGGW